MEIVNDADLLKRKMKEYAFDHIFSFENFPFSLVSYQKGELLNLMRDMTQTLIFVLEGSISIYSIHANGNVYHICNSQGFTLLGDMELIQKPEGDICVEALSDLLCIELSTAACKDDLLHDCCFLRYCLESVVGKLNQFVAAEAVAVTLEEKLMQYLQYNCQDHILSSVQSAADHLHCSRRQLQRLLKKLCEDGTLQKAGKGLYKYQNENTPLSVF